MPLLAFTGFALPVANPGANHQPIPATLPELFSRTPSSRESREEEKRCCKYWDEYWYGSGSGDNPNNCRMPRIGERLEVTPKEKAEDESKKREGREEKKKAKEKKKLEKARKEEEHREKKSRRECDLDGDLGQ